MGRYDSKPDYKELVDEYNCMNEEEKNYTIMNPGHVDEGTWDKAKKISVESYGEKRWPFIMYMYEKLKGK